MTTIIKRLALGIFLIALASGILLATDQEWRPKRTPSKGGARNYSVAILQHASVPALDEGTAGAIDALAARGFKEGENLTIRRYNAQGDVGNSSTIAREILNEPHDLVITISTLSLQAVAAANRDGRMRHVFGVVADPFSAGVGCSRDEPAKHPGHLVGQGIFLPVDDSFRLARQFNPQLKKVGVVWNSSESNSLAFMVKARALCKTLEIDLLEQAAENSAGVLEATHAAIGRGAQAIWVGGDVTVSVAIDSVISAARSAGIPVFTITPGKPDRGTFFDIGINFYECGKHTGDLAADVLEGKDPASIPIRDIMDIVPKRLVINKLVLKDLKEDWTIPDKILRNADIVIDETGIHEKAAEKGKH